MPILTTDFPALTADLQDIFNETAKTSISELTGFKLFKIQDTNRLTYDHLILHGLGGVDKVAEGADLPNKTLVEGDSVTWTQDYFGALVPVSKKMRKFDLHNQIESLVRSITDGAFDQIDQAFSDVLLNGFSASNYVDPYGESVAATGYDGNAFFYASHSNNINSEVFSNIITDSTVNPVLSREAVDAAMVAARKYRDPSQVYRRINLDTLLVSPDKYDEALRIINSPQVSGEFVNDINPLKGKVKVMQWEKLAENSAGSDTSNYWFMYDSKKVGESLRGLFAERPSLDAPEQVYKNKNWDYSIDFYYAIGRGFNPYIMGSNATKA